MQHLSLLVPAMLGLAEVLQLNNRPAALIPRAPLASPVE
jgi:hypothetical protein